MAAVIPRAYIDNYTAAIDGITEQVKDKLYAAFEKVDVSDVEAAREQIIAIMNAYLSPYTDMAAQVSATFYEGIRAMQIGGAYTALVESGRDAAATEGAVRAFMQTIVDGKPKEELVGKLLSRAGYEIGKAAGDCIVANGKRDRKRVMFARVPSGSETCDFCIMLASRGFVYKSSASAGEMRHYHDNCKCRTVPSFVDGTTIGD